MSNGLITVNGISTINGLEASSHATEARTLAAEIESDKPVLKSLTAINETGLPTQWALADSKQGLSVLKDMVRCALPEGTSVTLHDSKLKGHELAGGVGVAPEWETGTCGEECQEWVSSCLLAHVNLTGKHVPLWMDASHDNVGWGQSDEFPRQEGAYFGNLFAKHPVAYACKGVDADADPIAGRLCLGDESCPYVEAAPGAACEDICDEHAAGDGYTTCNVDGRTFSRPVTVWTH